MKKLAILLFCMVIGLAAAAVRAQNPDALSAEAAPAKDESMVLLVEGSKSYNDADYKAAIPIYEKALQLQKKKRTLERRWWLMLVDNLSFAYGVTGDVDASRAVIEYGISKEPTYPMFYYNNAWGYAQQNDEDNAIKNLRLAFKYKANANKGNELPDPAKDESFAELMKSQKFLKALMEMKAAK